MRIHLIQQKNWGIDIINQIIDVFLSSARLGKASILEMKSTLPVLNGGNSGKPFN